MNRTIAQLRSDVNDKMVKKFGMNIDFDEMEEAVLTRLLMNQPKVDDAAAKHREKELRKLQVIFELLKTHFHPSIYEANFLTALIGNCNLIRRKDWKIRTRNYWH